LLRGSRDAARPLAISSCKHHFHIEHASRLLLGPTPGLDDLGKSRWVGLWPPQAWRPPLPRL